MASSGSVEITTLSVDYNGGGPYTRGAFRLTNVVGWSVNDNSDISFWSISSSDNVGGSWFICTSGAGYNVELVPQVSYNGGASWENLTVVQRWVSEICSAGGMANTITMSTTLIGRLGSYHLRGDCMLRFLYYMTVAPAPDAGFPHAFPNSSYSEAVQVPVHVEVSWDANLRFDGNGGTGVPADITRAVTGVDSTTITIPNNIPTWGWHRFDGYSTNRDSRTAQYQPGDTVTLTKSSPSMTLYAIWTEFWDATLHFDGNGGTGVPADIVRRIYGESSTTVTIPNNIPTWVWHRFEGYSLNQSAATGEYHPGDTITITKSNSYRTLYAIWTEYYRPGAQLKSGVWKSHQRSGGACNVRQNGSWVEKRTIDGGTATNDPPQFRDSGQWKNMHRIGDET